MALLPADMIMAFSNPYEVLGRHCRSVVKLNGGWRLLKSQPGEKKTFICYQRALEARPEPEPTILSCILGKDLSDAFVSMMPIVILKIDYSPEFFQIADLTPELRKKLAMPFGKVFHLTRMECRYDEAYINEPWMFELDVELAACREEWKNDQAAV